MSNHLNITRIKVGYHALEQIAKDVVFVDGATVLLYADRLASKSRNVKLRMLSYAKTLLFLK